MSFMDKIKDVLSVPDDDYYEDDNTQEQEPEKAAPKAAKAEKNDFFSSSSNSAAASDKRSKYVNINATTQLQVVLVKPERFDDAPSIADHLNNKRTVVLNLESADKNVARRLIDFLSGVAYANKGTLKRVANSTFIITPYNVDIMGDLILDELENSNLYI